jgi:NIMA (never in mitosis gene a)-related kinase
MKGVVFTATGETLATPTPAELTNLFVNSPKVGLNFAKIFDFEEEDQDREEGSDHGDDDSDVEGPPPSPSLRDRAKTESKSIKQRESSAGAPPSRLRRPSIRRSVQHPGLPASTSDPTGLSSPAPLSNIVSSKRPSSSAAVASTAPKKSVAVPQSSPPAPEYDFSDEENLPSPFLKRVERETTITGARNKGPNKKPSSGNLLRVVAAANAANANANAAAGTRPGSAGKGSVKNGLTRPSVTSARKASEEARKALLRQ